MDRMEIINALITLNGNNPLECEVDISQILDQNYQKTCTIHNPPQNPQLPNEEIFSSQDDSTIWKYISLNLYLLLELKTSLDESPPEDVLSVQQNKSINECLKQLTGLGIRCNLISKLPQFYRHKSSSLDDMIMKRYERLAATSYTLYLCVRSIKLRAIATNYFQTLLNAIYQIVYCPVKKPNNNVVDGFVMTVEIHERLMRDRIFFNECLPDLSKSVHKSVYTKHTMVLHQQTAPVWFKKAVGNNLTKILCSPNGLETITSALLDNLDYDSNDSTKNWSALDVILKLITSLKNSSEFPNICSQVRSLLTLQGERATFFELIFVACTKVLYIEEDEQSKIFLDALLKPLTFTSNEEDVTSIRQCIRLLHQVFIVESRNYPDLPLKIIKPVINIVFKLFVVTLNSDLSDLNHQLSEILIKYLEEFKSERVEIYDVLFFNRKSDEIRNVCIVLENDKIVITPVKANLNTIGETIIKLLRNRDDLLMEFFVYLLSCLNSKAKYFSSLNDETNDFSNLAQTEDSLNLAPGVELNLIVLSLLRQLSEDKAIQAQMKKNPCCLVDYINSVLRNIIDTNLHLSNDIEPDDVNSIFITMMTLQASIANCDNVQAYRKLVVPLKHIWTQCVNDDFKELVSDVLRVLENSLKCRSRLAELSEVDLAIEEVCDPLLPIRGHGLMTLAKLVEKKDKEVMERKMFILNIFQQNLKNEDSFIYLSAINGLTAMGDIFPDLVLKVLIEEYSDFGRKDTESSNELRMKLGEVLVRITKNLGDAATKHKSLLLNTFLAASKDDDHLIRASSLSNLGEVCRVLGYKLDSIATEVLGCVHDVISTDKAVEARRAAVTVIRQLFIGLKSELLGFLKDDILEIYRTLKRIYKNDEDDVMRLQAQLALEELNEHMKTFVFPNFEVGIEKKAEILDKK